MEHTVLVPLQNILSTPQEYGNGVQSISETTEWLGFLYIDWDVVFVPCILHVYVSAD